jgi:hypothetical protein
MREHSIEACVRVGQLVDRGGLEADIRNTVLGCDSPSTVNLGWLCVDADDLAGCDGLGQAHCDRAWTAAAVEHTHAWP